MANAYSPIRQYGEYIQPYNFDLLAKGLEYKQQRFDANVALIQQKIDQFAKVDILKPEDREYFTSRVSALVDGINRTSSMSSFDSAGVTRNIQSQIKNVFDQTVMNAVSSTANARKLQAEIEDVKKNKPDQYAAQNELFATRGLRQYLSDGQVGSVYNGGSYTPFYNIQKELLPIMKDLHKYADVEKRTTPTGNGYYVTRTGKRISPEEVRRIAESVLPAQANTQLQIDGWYNYGRGPSALASTTQQFETFKNDSLGAFDSRIADLKVRLSSTANGAGAKKEALQKTLTALNTRRESLRSIYDSWIASGDINNMSYTLQKNKLMDGLGARYGFTETELTYSTDQSYWNGQELKYKRWKALLDVEQKEKDRQAKAKKAEQETPSIRRQVVKTEGEKEINLLDDAQKTIESSTLRRNSLINNKFNSLPSNLRGDIEILYENRPDKEQTKEDFLFDYFRKLSQDPASSGIVTIGEFDQMNSANNIALTNKQVLNEAFDEAVAENEAEVFPKVFKVALNNPNIKMNIDGQAVPINEYLKFKGIDTYEELQNNPEELIKFKKQVYADIILSRGTKKEFDIKQLASLFGEGEEKVPDDIGPLSEIPSRVSSVPGRVGGFGTPVTSSEFFGRRYNIPENPNSMPKTMAFLRQVQSSGAFDTEGGFVDDSFQDDRESNRLLSPDNLRQKMTSVMASRKADLPQQNEFLLRPDTDLHSQVQAVVDGQVSNSFLSVKSSPFTVAIDPADLGSVIIKQKIKEGTVEGTRNISENEAKIPVENLPPELLSNINLNIQKPVFNVNNFVPVERGDVAFIDEVNSGYLDELNTSVFGGNQGLTQIATRQGAALELFRNYPDVLGGFNQNTTQAGLIVKNVLFDDRFAVTMKPTKNRDGVRIGVQYDTGPDAQVIYSPLQPITDGNLDQITKIVDYAPQVLIYNMVNSMLSDIRLNGGQVPNGTYEKLKDIYTQNGRR